MTNQLIDITDPETGIQQTEFRFLVESNFLLGMPLIRALTANPSVNRVDIRYSDSGFKTHFWISVSYFGDMEDHRMIAYIIATSRAILPYISESCDIIMRGF